MPPLDIGAWLAPVDANAPTGPNLEFDAKFVELERAAAGKPEQQYGKTVIPAEEPDWKDVGSRAEDLLTRTRDLRVLAHLAVARLRLGGVRDYADVLGATRHLLETRWADVHPRLDPEEDNDPTLRANALLAFADPGRVLRFLRDMPIARSARLGQYCWRELTAAQAGGTEAEPNEALIASAFADTDPAWLAALREGVALAEAEASRTVAAFEQAAGAASGPDFDALGKLLHDIGHAVTRYGAAASPAQGAVEAEAPAEPGANVSGAASVAPVATAAARQAPARLGEVTSRADALRMLDLVCQYYRRHEPSSPLPLLIERARRLAEKDFIAVLRDLAPDAVAQAQFITGSQGGSQGE